MENKISKVSLYSPQSFTFEFSERVPVHHLTIQGYVLKGLADELNQIVNSNPVRLEIPGLLIRSTTPINIYLTFSDIDLRPDDISTVTLSFLLLRGDDD